MRLKLILLTLLLALAACRTPDMIERAFVTPQHVEEAIAFEAQLSSRYDTLPQADEPWFEILPGSTRVLLVAGHATAQTREGAMKGPDRGTGALAVALHKLTNAPLIYTTRRSPSDPNYYDDNAFKEAVGRLIAEKKPLLVLDIHGSHSHRPYEVDFGVMGGRSLLGRDEWLNRLIAILRNDGLLNLSRDFFPAAKQQTVTKYASRLGVPAIQLEISSTYLDPGRDPLYGHRFAQVLQALARFIRTIDPVLGGSG